MKAYASPYSAQEIVPTISPQVPPPGTSPHPRQGSAARRPARDSSPPPPPTQPPLRQCGRPGLGGCPPRRPLLEEGAESLLSVGGPRIHRHHRLGEVVGAVLVELDLLVERLLAAVDDERAGAGYRRHELTAGGRRDAMDLRDHRLRQPVDRLHQLGAAIEEALVEGQVAPTISLGS